MASASITQGALYNVSTTPGQNEFVEATVSNPDCYTTSSQTFSRSDTYTNQITLRFAGHWQGCHLLL